MIVIQPTDELRAVAQRVIWFKPPDEALRNPVHFLAHVMTYGTPEDLSVVQRVLDRDAFREALAEAPPGVFDKRSWWYWNLVLRRLSPPPPMPERVV